MGILNKLFGRRKDTETAPRSMEVGHPVMPEHTDPLLPTVEDIGAAEAVGKVLNGEVCVLDVRYEHEYNQHHIPGAKLVPLPMLAERYRELDPAATTLVVCEHGMRSLQACGFLSRVGFKKLYNLIGGMSVYSGPREGSRFNERSR